MCFLFVVEKNPIIIITKCTTYLAINLKILFPNYKKILFITSSKLYRKSSIITKRKETFPVADVYNPILPPVRKQNRFAFWAEFEMTPYVLSWCHRPKVCSC